MNLKSVGLGLLATSAAATAAEAHVASIEVIKYVGTVCGAIYALGKLVNAVLIWGNHRVKDAVEESIDKRFAALPCVRKNGWGIEEPCDGPEEDAG